MMMRTVFFLVSCLWLLSPFKSSSANGYHTLIPCEDGFLAAGSGGRMDWISAEGTLRKTEKFPEIEWNCLLADQKLVYAAGDRGSLWISTDGNLFKKMESGTEKNILSLASLKGQIMAGSEQGTLLLGDEKGQFKRIQLGLKGNIVSLSARTSDCYGVTDMGEIIHSTDGLRWSILDFNEFYTGFYKPCSFTKVLAMEHQVAVAGKYDDGSPVLMFSAQGSVWSERTLNYTDDLGQQSFLTECPSDLFYDSTEDQLLMVCSKGQIMKIPSCSHCNKLSVVSTDNLNCISGNGNSWMVVGDHFFIKVLDAPLNF